LMTNKKTPACTSRPVRAPKLPSRYASFWRSEWFRGPGYLEPPAERVTGFECRTCMGGWHKTSSHARRPDCVPVRLALEARARRATDAEWSWEVRSWFMVRR